MLEVTTDWYYQDQHIFGLYDIVYNLTLLSAQTDDQNGSDSTYIIRIVHLEDHSETSVGIVKGNVRYNYIDENFNFEGYIMDDENDSGEYLTSDEISKLLGTIQAVFDNSNAASIYSEHKEIKRLLEEQAFRLLNARN